MTLEALPTLAAPFPARRPRETLEQSWNRLGDGPGWTYDILGIVEPYVLGRPEEEDDVARFRDLPWTAAAQLLSAVPREALADRQNGAPSLGALLVAAVGHPREVELHGYLVPPSRPDERITGDGLVIYDHPELEDFLLVESDDPCEDTGCECRAFWSSVQASFGLEDAQEGPDLVVPRTCLRTGRQGWYLW